MSASGQSTAAHRLFMDDLRDHQFRRRPLNAASDRHTTLVEQRRMRSGSDFRSLIDSQPERVEVEKSTGDERIGDEVEAMAIDCTRQGARP